MENQNYIPVEYDQKKIPRPNREKSFRARWGSTLSAKGITPIANLFLNNYIKMGLNAVEAMFIIHLFSYKWTVDAPFPSLITVSIKMGKSVDTIRRLCRGLEKKGFLKRNFRTGQTSTYDLNVLIRRIEDFILCAKLNRGSLQIPAEPSAPMQTKEEPLRISTNNTSVKSIRDILREKSLR